MDIKENLPLSNLTTFRIGGDCLYCIEVSSEPDLIEAIQFAHKKSLPILIVGGGSNLLVADEGFPGVIIRISILGKEMISESEDSVILKVGSGNNWDDLVAYVTSNNWWGMENLSAIPGLVGAVPVQNVGAYGQEASQIVEAVEAIDLKTLKKESFTTEQCKFAYRSSKFNTEWKAKYAITAVTFKLNKKGRPNLSYSDVKKYFDQHSEIQPTIETVRNAIIEIRKGKFPDLNKVGNAGSFFKNLILTDDQYRVLEDRVSKNFGSEALDKLKTLKARFAMPDAIKIPTAFVIDLCNLKGRSIGEAKLWELQPLVIVNVGTASAADVLKLYQVVKQTVLAKTGMELQHEPEFINITE
jgi:UDP-N-acetylmuramate dehydrogenase